MAGSASSVIKNRFDYDVQFGISKTSPKQMMVTWLDDCFGEVQLRSKGNSLASLTCARQTPRLPGGDDLPNGLLRRHSGGFQCSHRQRGCMAYPCSSERLPDPTAAGLLFRLPSLGVSSRMSGHVGEDEVICRIVAICRRLLFDVSSHHYHDRSAGARSFRQRKAKDEE